MSDADAPEAGPLPGDDDDSGDVPEQFRIRHAKRQRLLESGAEAYPVSVPRTHSLAEIRAEHPDLAPDTATGCFLSRRSTTGFR